jgi:hypothetical protein
MEIDPPEDLTKTESKRTRARASTGTRASTTGVRTMERRIGLKIKTDQQDYIIIEGTQYDGRCFSASVFYCINKRIAEDKELNYWITDNIIVPINEKLDSNDCVGVKFVFLYTQEMMSKNERGLYRYYGHGQIYETLYEAFVKMYERTYRNKFDYNDLNHAGCIEISKMSEYKKLLEKYKKYLERLNKGLYEWTIPEVGIVQILCEKLKISIKIVSKGYNEKTEQRSIYSMYYRTDDDTDVVQDCVVWYNGIDHYKPLVSREKFQELRFGNDTDFDGIDYLPLDDDTNANHKPSLEAPSSGYPSGYPSAKIPSAKIPSAKISSIDSLSVKPSAFVPSTVITAKNLNILTLEAVLSKDQDEFKDRLKQLMLSGLVTPKSVIKIIILNFFTQFVNINDEKFKPRIDDFLLAVTNDIEPKVFLNLVCGYLVELITVSGPTLETFQLMSLISGEKTRLLKQLQAYINTFFDPGSYLFLSKKTRSERASTITTRVKGDDKNHDAVDDDDDDDDDDYVPDYVFEGDGDSWESVDDEEDEKVRDISTRVNPSNVWEIFGYDIGEGKFIVRYFVSGEIHHIVVDYDKLLHFFGECIGKINRKETKLESFLKTMQNFDKRVYTRIKSVNKNDDPGIVEKYTLRPTILYVMDGISFIFEADSHHDSDKVLNKYFFEAMEYLAENQKKPDDPYLLEIIDSYKKTLVRGGNSKSRASLGQTDIEKLFREWTGKSKCFVIEEPGDKNGNRYTLTRRVITNTTRLCCQIPEEIFLAANSTTPLYERELYNYSILSSTDAMAGVSLHHRHDEIPVTNTTFSSIDAARISEKTSAAQEKYKYLGKDISKRMIPPHELFFYDYIPFEERDGGLTIQERDYKTGLFSSLLSGTRYYIKWTLDIPLQTMSENGISIQTYGCSYTLSLHTENDKDPKFDLHHEIEIQEDLGPETEEPKYNITTMIGLINTIFTISKLPSDFSITNCEGYIKKISGYLTQMDNEIIEKINKLPIARNQKLVDTWNALKHICLLHLSKLKSRGDQLGYSADVLGFVKTNPNQHYLRLLQSADYALSTLFCEEYEGIGNTLVQDPRVFIGHSTSSDDYKVKGQSYAFIPSYDRTARVIALASLIQKETVDPDKDPDIETVEGLIQGELEEEKIHMDTEFIKNALVLMSIMEGKPYRIEASAKSGNPELMDGNRDTFVTQGVSDSPKEPQPEFSQYDQNQVPTPPNLTHQLSIDSVGSKSSTSSKRVRDEYLEVIDEDLGVRDEDSDETTSLLGNNTTKPGILKYARDIFGRIFKKGGKSLKKNKNKKITRLIKKKTNKKGTRKHNKNKKYTRKENPQII